MRYLALLLIITHLFAVDAKLTIEKDVDQRSRVALIDGSDAVDESLRNAVHKIILADLRVSGHFLPEETYHAGSYDSPTIAPHMRSFEHIILYKLQMEAQRTVLHVTLLKASDGSTVLTRQYAINNKAKYPFLIHKAVSDLNDALGFRSIAWITRFVLFSRYVEARQTQIVLADYTFHYIKTILSGGNNLFPHWAGSEQKKFYYTNYDSTYPTLHRLDIYTGQTEKITTSDGMLVCSDVSRDGSRLLLTMGPDGQADIFEYTLATGAKRKLTTFRGIDVNGRFIDNDGGMLFVSNRLGSPNLYKKTIGGSAVPVVYHGANNSAFDVEGSRIVYSSKEGRGVYNLYLSDINGEGVRPLTSGGTNQSPKFAPGGEIIMYTKRVGRDNSIGYINLISNQSVLFPLGGKTIQSYDW